MARTRSGKQELETGLDALLSSDRFKDNQRYMEDRWRPQVMVAKRRVDSNREWYYGWRVPTVVGALVLPPLASPTVATSWVRWAALVVSLIVAACTALESTFRFGNRWRLYRRLLGELRAEGWAYVYGTTPYSKDSEFKLFVERSEAAMRRYDEAYVSEVLVLGLAGPGGEDQQTGDAQPKPA